MGNLGKSSEAWRSRRKRRSSLWRGSLLLLWTFRKISCCKRFVHWAEKCTVCRTGEPCYRLSILWLLCPLFRHSTASWLLRDKSTYVLWTLGTSSKSTLQKIPKEAVNAISTTKGIISFFRNGIEFFPFSSYFLQLETDLFRAVCGKSKNRKVRCQKHVLHTFPNLEFNLSVAIL